MKTLQSKTYVTVDLEQCFYHGVPHYKNQLTCRWDIIVISIYPMAIPKLGHINLLLFFFAQKIIKLTLAIKDKELALRSFLVFCLI